MKSHIVLILTNDTLKIYYSLLNVIARKYNNINENKLLEICQSAIKLIKLANVELKFGKLNVSENEILYLAVIDVRAFNLYDIKVDENDVEEFIKELNKKGSYAASIKAADLAQLLLLYSFVENAREIVKKLDELLREVKHLLKR